MKIKSLLVVSIILNIGLAVGLVVHRPAKSGDSSASPAGAPPIAKETMVVAAQPVTIQKSDAKFDWRMVESADYKKYIANLRAIGCPEETIRDIITADVNSLFKSRLKEVAIASHKFAYWKTGNVFAGGMSPEQTAKLQALNKEKLDLLRELLGVEPDASADLMASFNATDNTLDFLAGDKQRAVADIYAKYQDRLTKATGNGMPNSADMKNLHAIQKEMDAELAKSMSPEEYREYQMRTSSTAMSMRAGLTSFEPTQDEFDKIFDAKKKFDDEFADVSPGPNASKEDQDKLKAAETEMNDQLKSVMGDARYAEYQRSQDVEYQAMAQVADQYNLSKDVASKVYDMKAAAETQAKAVRKDKTLSPAQRADALQAIQNETQNSVQQVMGDQAWGTYQNQATWLNGLASRTNPGKPQKAVVTTFSVP